MDPQKLFSKFDSWHVVIVGSAESGKMTLVKYWLDRSSAALDRLIILQPFAPTIENLILEPYTSASVSIHAQLNDLYKLVKNKRDYDTEAWVIVLNQVFADRGIRNHKLFRYLATNGPTKNVTLFELHSYPPRRSELLDTNTDYLIYTSPHPEVPSNMRFRKPYSFVVHDKTGLHSNWTSYKPLDLGDGMNVNQWVSVLPFEGLPIYDAEDSSDSEEEGSESESGNGDEEEEETDGSRDEEDETEVEGETEVEEEKSKESHDFELLREEELVPKSQSWLSWLSFGVLG